MNINIFSKYWNILKRNYQDKTHTKEDLLNYYSIFKDYEEKDFIFAVKQVLKYQAYFPRIDEIVKYLPTKEEQEVPKWFDKALEIETPTKEEQKELEKIINELEKNDGNDKNGS